MSLRTEYLNFLKANFNRLKIQKPLFYNWDLGLRFDLQKEFANQVNTGNENYFNEVYHRDKTYLNFVLKKMTTFIWLYLVTNGENNGLRNLIIFLN